MKGIKAYFTVLALSLTAAFGAHAQSGGMKGGDMKDMPAKDAQGLDKKDLFIKEMKEMKADRQSQIHKGSGTVQKIDAAKGAVTIAHGPVKTLSWPAMTMTFAMKDKNMLDKIKTGSKVEFSFVESGKVHVVTEIKGH